MHLPRGTQGKKMRCKRVTRQIGPYIDGELNELEAREIREHLDACKDCAQRYISTRMILRDVASLPAIIPTPEESYRLMNRLRREMASPAPSRAGGRRLQVAAATISLLVIGTVAGVTLAVWSGGGTTTVVEERSAEDFTPSEAFSESERMVPESSSVYGEGTGLAAATMTAPDLVISEKEYAPEELEGFRNDLGTRLDFYSTYWYPASSSPADPADLAELQADLTEDMVAQAAAAGQDPEELERAVTAVLEQEEGEPVLPCYAELATIDGNDTWLVSVSGPEDYLLFPDKQRPPAMFLASMGGEEGLKISESLLRQLAAMLAPSSEREGNLAGTYKGMQNSAWDAAAGGTAPATSGDTDEGEEQGDTESSQKRDDFKSFLRKLAAQGTSLEIISALEGLDYEQMLMLINGDWGSLAADGVNLSDFLTPPQRLQAVDCTTGQVVWPPGN